MRLRRIGLPTAIVLLAAACDAQQSPAEVPLQISNSHYVTIGESIVVDTPVDRFGHGSADPCPNLVDASADDC